MFFLPYRTKDTDSEEDMIGERIPTSANRWANDLSTHPTDTTVDSNKLAYNVHGRKDPSKLRCDIISPAKTGKHGSEFGTENFPVASSLLYRRLDYCTNRHYRYRSLLDY